MFYIKMKCMTYKIVENEKDLESWLKNINTILAGMQ